MNQHRVGGPAGGRLGGLIVLAGAFVLGVGPGAHPAQEQASVQLRDTPGLRFEGDPVLEIRVLDADGDQPLERFVVVAGVDVDDDLVERRFIEQHGPGQVVNWQSHTVREGRDGVLWWPLPRAYDPLALRVEAEGRVPLRCAGIDKQRGSQTVVFRLRRDPGIVAQLFLPDGSPAAEAEVAIAMVSRRPPLEGASFGFGQPEPESLRDRWCRGIVRRADARGQVPLPTESDPTAVVVAVHPRGVAQIAFADLARSRLIQLEAWASLEGRVMFGDRPAPGEKVFVHDAPRQSAIYPGRFVHHHERCSDAEGRFVVEFLPPGWAELSLPDRLPVVDARLPWSFVPPIPEGATRRVALRAGQRAEVVLGSPNFRPDPDAGGAPRGPGSTSGDRGERDRREEGGGRG